MCIMAGNPPANQTVLCCCLSKSDTLDKSHNFFYVYVSISSGVVVFRLFGWFLQVFFGLFFNTNLHALLILFV